jgi:hypothetical protein
VSRESWSATVAPCGLCGEIWRGDVKWGQWPVHAKWPVHRKQS